MKIIDKYIIRTFLMTFFYSIGLIVAIAIVFDFSEKVDDFIDRQAPASAIAFRYYLNFIPYFANLFSPLFVFISVIFFTSRMANRTETVAIFCSGISFPRFLVPYFVAASCIALLSLYLNNYIIPRSNEKRLAFENQYIRNPFVFKYRNIHRQLDKGNFIYFESFNNYDNVGFRFSNERFNKGEMYYKLSAERIVWDSIVSEWRIEQYTIREFDGMNEKILKGNNLDTSYAFTPEEFKRRESNIETMDTPELIQFIRNEKARGVANTAYMEVERHRRTSFPFATFILTIIGVSISSKKVKGGLGMQLGIGIFIAFAYIMLMQVSTTFAIKADFSPLVSVWIPNAVFALVAVFLFRKSNL